MSQGTRRLRRLAVVSASAALLAGGVLPLSSGTAFAATGDNASAATISPTSGSTTVGTCSAYQVTATPASTTTKFDVQLSQTVSASGNTAGTTVSFCNVSGFTGVTNGSSTTTAGNKVAANAAGTSTVNAQFSTDAHGVVTFGVTSTNPGTVAIHVYNDINGNNVFEPAVDTSLASASASIVANVVSGVACTPTSETNPVGTPQTVTCSLTTSSGSPATAASPAVVRLEIVSGPDVSSSHIIDCTDVSNPAAGAYGRYACTFTNNGTAGTDHIVAWYDANNDQVIDAGEPTQTGITATWLAAAPSTAVVHVTCATNQTDAAGDSCQNPLTAKTEAFTATVLSNATASATPVAGVKVSWTENGGSTASVSPTQCTTDAHGQCGTTLTETKPANNETVRVTATVPTYSSGSGAGSVTGSGTKTWHTPQPTEARNVAVAPKTATQTSGGVQTFVATVTDRFGNPVQSACVAWSTSGPGHFVSTSSGNLTGCELSYDASTGVYQHNNAQFFCFTNASGQCSAQVGSNPSEAGDQRVTADIGNAHNNSDLGVFKPECTSAAGQTYASTAGGPIPGTTPQAYVAPHATAGNCTDSGVVTWKQRTQVKTVTVTAPPGEVGTTEKVTITALNDDNSPAAGTVLSVNVSGANAANANVTTNAQGVATFSYIPRNAGLDTILATAPNGVQGSATTTIGPSQVKTVTVIAPPGEVGTTEVVTITAVNSDGSPAVGTALSVNVSGANAANGNVLTNTDGEATFSYTPRKAGIDTITATAANGVQGQAKATIRECTRNCIAIHPNLTLASPARGKLRIIVHSTPRNSGAAVTIVVRDHGTTTLHGRLDPTGHVRRMLSLPPGSLARAQAFVAPNGLFQAGRTPVRAHRVRRA